MSDKTSGKSIVPSGKTDLLASGAGGNRLIRRAASDALVPMNSVMNRPEPILHRVGNYELHDEDFRQLKFWASELKMIGKELDLLKELEEAFKEAASERLSIAEYKELTDFCADGRIRYFAHI